ncbi:putative LTR retrotransposon, partial [Pseudoloma neurophilia]
HEFAKAKIFSKIDLTQGFYQIEIAHEDRHKTAFSTHRGKFQFNRLPFGLKTSQKFFQSVLNNVLSELKNVFVFVDDIIIYSPDKNNHLKTLKKPFSILGNYNIHINKEKSEFFKSSISYLGYKLHDGKYTHDESRLKDFSLWKRPRSRKQLQSLIGQLNWYRSFVKDLSSRISFLYDKL